MLLDAITDNLEIILDKAITTNQLSFSVYYNEYTSSAVTPMQNTSVTNNTTAVNLIAAPGATGNQRQLRWCSINNVDTADVGVKIRFKSGSDFRNVLYVYLRVNESIQYSEETGWRVYTANGEEKVSGFSELPGTLRMPKWFGAADVLTTFTTVSSTAYCVYLGVAERVFSSVKLAYRTTTALAGVGSWGEVAIYKGNPTLQTGTSFTRLGYTDVTTVLQAAASTKLTTITTSSMSIGDNLWAVLSASGTTQVVLRAGVVDNLGAGFYQTSASTRPQTSSTFTGTVNSTSAPIWWSWQGIYQGT